MEEAKQELQEVVEFLKNPQKFTVLGGKLPKGKIFSLVIIGVNHRVIDYKFYLPILELSRFSS